MSTQLDALLEVCRSLDSQDLAAAANAAQTSFPFRPPKSVSTRAIGDADALRVFLRDGFTDRYSGERLVFPGTLRLISTRLPDQFPYHKNWKMSECHPIYWERFPTIDHVFPIARGGTDVADNWVTTSMLRNSAKANWTIEQLGWSLHPVGDLCQWDGLYEWFLNFVDANPSLRDKPGVGQWWKAAMALRRTM